MTGHINYGGRVTDDNDRILLMSLLRKCYGQHVIDPKYITDPKPKRKARKKHVEPTKFSFFDSVIYEIPEGLGTREEVLRYIETLPNKDGPEIFGMHKNASISYE